MAHIPLIILLSKFVQFMLIAAGRFSIHNSSETCGMPFITANESFW